MSYHVFFMFSSGIETTMYVPKGTTARIRERIAETEKALGLKTEQYRDNPPHWTTESKRFTGLDDKTLCRAVESHNSSVRWFYRILADSSGKKKDKDREPLTPKQAAEFWHGLELLEVDPERWTADYYRARMEAIYEAMRGRDSGEGITFDAPPLTAEQCDAVLNMFVFLDTHDIRLSVPWERDELVDTDQYRWCDKCGLAIHNNDLIEKADGEIIKCPKCKKIID